MLLVRRAREIEIYQIGNKFFATTPEDTIFRNIETGEIINEEEWKALCDYHVKNLQRAQILSDYEARCKEIEKNYKVERVIAAREKEQQLEALDLF